MMTDEEIARLLSAKHPSAKPRPAMTDEDVSRMLNGLPVVERDGPGAAASYARGLLVEGPAQLASGVGSATDALLSLRNAQQGFGESNLEGTRETLGGLVPIDEPVTQKEKTAQAAGVGTAFGVATLPLAAAGGLPLMAADIGLSTFGGAAGEESRAAAEAHGAGDIGQSAASAAGDLLISAAAPAAFIAKGPKVVKTAKDLAAAYKATPEVEAIAKSLGVPTRALVRDAGEFKAFAPEHASGDERYVAEWADALGEAIPRFGKDEMPTTRQILEAHDDAGSALASLEEGLGQGSKGFQGKVAGRRKAATDAIRDEYEGMLPDGSPDRAISAYEQIKRRREAAADRLWEAVPEEELPMIPTARIKAGAEEAVRRAGEFGEDVPEEALRVLDWPDEVTWERYQSMRSRSLRSDRIGRKSITETAAQHKANNRAPLIKALNEELDELAKVSGDAGEAYREALAATRKLHADFNPESVAVRAFEDMTEGPKIIGKIKNAKKPVEEAERALRIYDQEPGGRESLSRMLFDDLVGPGDLNPGRAKTSLANLSKHENVARTVMGDEAYESAVDLLERARVVSIGKTGKSAQAMSVGSGQGDIDAMATPLSMMIDPRGGGSSFVKKMIAKAMGDGAITSRILREAALDPKLAKVLLEMPTPRSVEAWAVNWQKLVKRASLRVATKEGTRGKKP